MVDLYSPEDSSQGTLKRESLATRLYQRNQPRLKWIKVVDYLIAVCLLTAISLHTAGRVGGQCLIPQDSSQTPASAKAVRSLPGELAEDVARSEKLVTDALNGPEDLDGIRQAIPAAEHALKVRQDEQGTTWWETIDAQHHLDDLSRMLVLSAEQRAELKHARTLNQQVREFYDTGNYTEAVNVALQASEIHRQILGEEHHDYATDLGNLALVYVNVGQYQQAEPLFLQAISIDKKVLGEEHPGYAIDRSNLANLYLAMDRHEQAEPLFLQALDIVKKARGADHPDNAIALNNLATFYMQMGRYEEAGPLFLQALNIVKRARGEDDPLYAADLDNLGSLYYAAGRYQQAESCLFQALQIVKKARGEDHPDNATALNNLAKFYTDIGRYKDAEPFLLQALEILKKSRGESHPDYAAALNNLGLLYWATGRFNEAEQELRQVVEINKRVRGEGHSYYAFSLSNLAQLYRDMRRNDDAEPLLRQALEIEKKTLPPGHPYYLISLNNLALITRDNGDYNESERLFREVLETQERTLGKAHPFYAIVLNNLGVLYRDMRRYQEEEPIFREVLEIERKALGEENISYTNALNSLATVLAATKREKEASELLEKSARGDWMRLTQNFPLMSDQQKRDLLKVSSLAQGPILLSLVFAGRSTAEMGLRGALLSKQLLFEATRQESAALAAAFASGSREWQASLLERDRLRSQASALTMQSLSEKGSLPQPGRKQVDLVYLRSLYDRIEHLEQQLRHTNQAYAEQARLNEISLDDVRHALRSDEALVEYVHYTSYDVEAHVGLLPRYGALVLRGDSGTVSAVDFGPAWGINAVDPAVQLFQKNINAFTAQWKQNAMQDPSPQQLTPMKSEDPKLPGVLSETRTALASAALRALVWDPLETYLSGVKRVYLAPDGQLSLIPFEALARDDGKGGWRYLLEERELVYVGTGRDLGRLSLRARINHSKTAVLIGNPAFFAQPERVAREVAGLTSTGERAPKAHSQSAATGMGVSMLGDGMPDVCSSMQIPRRLQQSPVLAQFVEGTDRQLRGLGWTVSKLTDLQATEEAVKQVQSPRILQFATHGYLLKCPANAQSWDNPLQHSMLMLAGVNSWRVDQSAFYHVGKELLTEVEARRRGLPGEQMEKNRIQIDDGILTAYEVTGMNLQGTELVNLTACETGLGEVTPDGIAGLRQGFLLAGARSLTMSLWEIPARESVQQMSDFYERWLGGSKRTNPKPKYQAFREAQLAALRRARIKYGKGHPFYWAGMVFSGDPGDLPPASATKAAPGGDEKR